MENVTLTRRAALLVAAVAFAGLAACERHSDVPPGPSTPDASAQVIGTPPAPPTGDPPGTTPVAPNTTEVTKQVETTQKPQEGDNHSYSTVDANSPQKAGGKDPIQADPERTQK
jgi:hypothetical protein